MTISTKNITFKELIKRPICFLGLGFGSGLAPKAPGTFGTLAAVPIVWGMQSLSLTNYLLVTLIAFIVGIWICQQSAQWLQMEDPSAVVWDEIVGYMVTMITAPKGWEWLLLGFILFRIFDIWKPWPIKWADQKLHGGFGIMVDDVIAGVFALILIQCISKL
jgi:phosphatidylglycerophosphatase A